MKKHLFLALLISATLTCLTFAYVRGRSSELQSTTAHPQEKSLHATAKRIGKKVVFTASPINMPQYHSVAQLTREALAVVIGIPEEAVGRTMNPDESFIATDYTIKVQRVLLGNVQAGDYLTVRVPGGFVQFEDGTSAELKMPDMWKNPEVGKSYVFFLMKSGKSTTKLELLGGPQGLFEIANDGSILPQVREDDELMRVYKGKNLNALSEEVKQTKRQ